MNPDLPAPVVGYIMSRFPKLTETFVLYEMAELKALGFKVIVLPLRLEREHVQHPEVAAFQSSIHAVPLLSQKTLKTNAIWFACHPVRYVTTLLQAVAATWRNPRFLAGALLYFPKAVCFADTAKRHHIRHIHAHFATHPAMAAWVVHKLCAIPYSFTAHGSDLHVSQLMLPRKASDAAFAVTISTYNKQFIAETCGNATAQRFDVIRTGTDLERFTPKTHNPAASEPVNIICVASFRTVKGHHVLLEACQRLRQQQLPFHCTLVGYGPQEEKIRGTIKELKLETCVTVAGPQPRNEVIRLLGESDIIALTSIQTVRGNREGIPVALMEGMACGLPVVASRISGIPELVKEEISGLLFEPGNPDDAAAALARLIRSPDQRVRMGKAAREAVEHDYNLVHNAEQLATKIALSLTPPAC
jgi:colanic acid/amylovoran biosynthesis glycosyltransferase